MTRYHRPRGLWRERAFWRSWDVRVDREPCAGDGTVSTRVVVTGFFRSLEFSYTRPWGPDR